MPSSDITAFQDALGSAKSIIILTGAGLSAGSGIPTYRGSGGLWRDYDAKVLATIQAWKENPSRVWQFHHERREQYLQAQPNSAHRALAALNIPATLERIAPALDSCSPPLLVTQNIDDLCQRSIEELPEEAQAAAKEKLLEMHGSLFVTRCTSCQHTKRSYDWPLCSALASNEDRDIPIFELPKCGGENWAGSNRYGRCGGLLRPAVVWFGEVPEHMGEVARKLNWCDLFIVVGTSSLVQPACGFKYTVKKRGGKVAVFNLEPTKGDENADFLFLGPCEETLPQALGV